MSEDMVCVKLTRKDVQTIIAALLLAASEEDHMSGRYDAKAEYAEDICQDHNAKLMREAAENCRRRAVEYRDVYGQLVSQK